MNTFFIKVNKLEHGIQKIDVGGRIDENCDFRRYTFSVAEKVIFDFDKIEMINIHGIKKWLQWIQTTFQRSELSFVHCPPCIVDQFNTIKGFLPPQSNVESFYVPYYNSKSDQKKNILFRKNFEFKDGKIFPPDLVTDDKGEDMEIDVIEEKYFSFLLSNSS